MPNFIALEIYFIFGTTFFWNEGLILVLMLIGRDFEFFCGYLVVLAHYLVVTARYLVVTTRYWWLRLITARSHFQHEQHFCGIKSNYDLHNHLGSHAYIQYTSNQLYKGKHTESYLSQKQLLESYLRHCNDQLFPTRC